eukprot:m.177219 g.177219  ORF g.177219 m.177219 type:complete len:623 (-) comp31876_c0_seq2:32-1900(-)
MGLAEKRTRLAQLKAARESLSNPSTPQRPGSSSETQDANPNVTPITATLPSGGGKYSIAARLERLSALKASRTKLTTKFAGTNSKPDPYDTPSRAPVTDDEDDATTITTLRAQLKTSEERTHELEKKIASAAIDVKNGHGSSMDQARAQMLVDEIERLKIELEKSEKNAAVTDDNAQQPPSADFMSGNTPQRHEPEATSASNGITALMDEQLAAYWLDLAQQGADLAQISADQTIQHQTINEYESLMNDAMRESAELRAQLRQSKDSQQQFEEYLSEYESENLKLIEELAEAEKKKEDNQQYKTAQSADSSDEFIKLKKKLKACEEEFADTKKQLESALQDLSTHVEQAAQTKEDMSNADKYTDDLSEQLRQVTAERDETMQNLQAAVREIESEEDRLQNEIELQKSIVASKSQESEREIRELNHHILAVEEERDELQRLLDARQTNAIALQGGKSSDNTLSQSESLFSELAAERDECEQCLMWQEKTKITKSQTKNLKTKIQRVEKDLKERSVLLDQVIHKWSAAVASFMVHRPGDPNCPCDNCTGIKPARPQKEETNANTRSRPVSPSSSTTSSSNHTNNTDGQPKQQVKKRRWGRFLSTKSSQKPQLNTKQNSKTQLKK